MLSTTTLLTVTACDDWLTASQIATRLEQHDGWPVDWAPPVDVEYLTTLLESLSAPTGPHLLDSVEVHGRDSKPVRLYRLAARVQEPRRQPEIAIP